MTLVTSYIEKYDSSATLITRKRAIIIDSEITQNGERAADTAKIKFSIKDSCKQGDIVKYIQDIVDVSFLKGIWNFENSFRDEGGYDMDGLNSNVTSTAFEDGLQGRVARIAVSGDAVTITNHNAIDFGKQFDIYIYCKPDTSPTTKATLFSSFNGTQGIEIGISATTGFAYVTISSGGSSTITGSNVNMFNGNPHWVRVKRDINNLVSLFVDGTAEGTTTKSGDLTNDVSLLFGNDHTSSNLYHGVLAQIRVYCGGLINDNDDKVIRHSARQPQTMRFAGIVWQGDDQTVDKIVKANGFVKSLTNTRPNPAVQGNIFGNGSDDAPIASLILSFLFKIYLPKFKYFDTGLLNHSVTKYSAVDTIFSNLSILSILYNANFHVNARQVVMTEPISLDHTYLRFENGKGYKIIQSGDDETALVNNFEVMVAPLKYSNAQLFSGNNTTGQTFHLTINTQFYGIYIKVGGISGFFEGLDYKVDYNANTVTTLVPFTAGSNNVAIQIVTQDLTANPIISKSKDATSIAQNGDHVKSVALQQISTDFLSALFATNYITKYSGVNKRITIEVPFLINSLRPNYLVYVKNSILGINGNFVVRSITWKYPKFTTEILVGEYLFNIFDLQSQLLTKINQIHAVTPRALNAYALSADNNVNPTIPDTTTIDGCLIATQCYVQDILNAAGISTSFKKETILEQNVVNNSGGDSLDPQFAISDLINETFSASFTYKIHENPTSGPAGTVVEFSGQFDGDSAGTTVTLKRDGTFLATTTTDGVGNWDISLVPGGAAGARDITADDGSGRIYHITYTNT